MEKLPQENTQRQHQRDYLSSRPLSLLTFNLVVVLTTIFAAAAMLVAALEPQTVKETNTAHQSKSQDISPQTTPELPQKQIQRKKIALSTDNPPDFKVAQTIANQPLQQSRKPIKLDSALPLEISLFEEQRANYKLINNQANPQKNTTVIAKKNSDLVARFAPENETESSETETESVPNRQRVSLSLSEVIILALENNRDIKNAYLDRIVQKQDLAVAEDEFVPNFTPEVSTSFAQSESDIARINTTGLGLDATVSVRIPTGGQLRFGWAGNAQAISNSDDPFRQELTLSFDQPLLRGAGTKVNRVPIEVARLTEESNLINLRSTLTNTITDTIFAYRRLLQAQERLKIEELSLQNAEELLQFNRVLIEAGRLAPVDIVQSETAVANRQVSLLDAQNDLEAARLNLIEVLDIERDIVILASEVPTAKPVDFKYDNLRKIAFSNQPDYLQAQLNLEISKLELLRAENNRLWDLNFSTSFNDSARDITDLRTGLVLSREIGDLTRERDFQRSRVNRLKAENNLQEREESLENQLTDIVRDIELRFSQVELAKRATELSERQLEIEREKQRLGRGATVFELVNLQNDLAQARNAELDATINYLNALTLLDQTIGTTLDTWQVTIEDLE